MARQRDWDSLSPRTQRSYAGTGANRYGWTVAETRAYYESGSNLGGLRRHAPSAAFRGSGGKSANVVSRSGVLNVDHLTKSERRLVAQHWHAVDRYLKTGDTSDYISPYTGRRVYGLDYFEGKEVNGVELEANPDSLDDMEPTGELDQSIYETE